MNVQLTIEFLSYWHVGSGLGQGAFADSLVLKDRDNIPWLPGKTVKGLFRESFATMCDAQQIDSQRLFEVFGAPSGKNDENVEPGFLAFSDANIQPEFREWLLQKENITNRECLYNTIASTSIDKNGIAIDKTLRTIEVCAPLVLQGRIALMDKKQNDLEVIKELQNAASLIRHLGSHRHRGLGRCRVTVETITENTAGGN